MAFTPGMEQELAVRVNGEGVEGFTGQMDEAIGALGGFKAAVGATGAALAALGAGGMAASINAARSFEETLVELEKVASPEVVEDMDTAIRDMAETIPLAQKELGTLASDAARFGIEGSENIRNFTETAARMSTATDLAANEAGESLAKLTTLMNVPIEQAENLGSAINTMGNEFATSSSEVVDASLRSSAALESLGLRETEIVGLNAAMNEVSESAERAGTRLRRVAQELMDPKKAEDVASALGMTTDEFKTMRDEDPAAVIRELAATLDEGGEGADKLRSSLSTVSQQAIGGLGSNLDGLDEALGRSSESFEQGTALQEEFDKQIDTTNAQIKLLRNRLTNVGIAIGEVLLPYVNDALDAFNNALDPLVAFNKETNGVAGAASLAAMTVGGLALAVGAFVSGPVGLAIAAAAALGAAYHTNFMGVRDSADAAFAAAERIVGKFTTVADRHVSRLMALYDTHGKALVSEFRETFAAVSNRVRQFVGFVDRLMGDEIIGVLRFAFDTMSVLVTRGMDSILTAIRVVLALIRGDFGEALDLVKGFWTRTFDELDEYVRRWGDRLVDYMVGVATGVGSAIKDAINSALGLPFNHTIGEVEVGGETVFGGQTLGIPALAEGGVVDGATLAMIGEAGPEAVVPLDRASEFGGAASGDVARQVSNALSGATIRIETGDETLDSAIKDRAQLVVDSNERQKKRMANTRRS
ncbi:tape measure protein [Halorubrum phage Hardycor1]|nr:tape measure protein [Halorubrum phage Hardycor1]